MLVVEGIKEGIGGENDGQMEKGRDKGGKAIIIAQIRMHKGFMHNMLGPFPFQKPRPS